MRESKYNQKHKHSTASNNLSQYYEKTGTIEQTYKKLRAEFTAEANLSSNFVTKPFLKILFVLFQNLHFNMLEINKRTIFHILLLLLKVKIQKQFLN